MASPSPLPPPPSSPPPSSPSSPSFPSSYVLDDLSQLSFPSYTQCLYIYSTPHIESFSEFSSLCSSLSLSFEKCLSSSFFYLNYGLKRDHENGGKITLHSPNSVPCPIDFQEVEGWCPTKKSLEVGDLKGWPVMSKLIGTSILIEEEHISVKIRVSWCHSSQKEGKEGGKEGEKEREKEEEREKSVVVIAGMYSHILFDGSTRNLFMNEWAAVHRKMFDCEISSLPFPSQPPVFDPSVLIGKSSPPVSTPKMARYFYPHEEMKALFVEEQTKRITLRVLFPKSVLEKLQNECSTEETKVSKNDCLFALIWKSLQTATPKTIFTCDGDHFATTAMSVRGRYPGFSPRHCGNAIVLANITVGDVREASLGEIARTVRKAILHDSQVEQIQSVMDFSHQIPTRKLGLYSGFELGKGFVATQWRNLNMYHTNFGPSLGGTPTLIIPPYDFDGFLITLPPRPSSSPFPKGDEEEGIIAQFSLFGEVKGGEEGERERERERVLKMLPEGVRVLTELNLDVNL